MMLAITLDLLKSSAPQNSTTGRPSIKTAARSLSFPAASRAVKPIFTGRTPYFVLTVPSNTSLYFSLVESGHLCVNEVPSLSFNCVLRHRDFPFIPVPPFALLVDLPD